MNKYTELSDFEINKRVAEKLGITHECDMGTVIIYMDSEHHAFDPCDNVEQAWEIMMDNEIIVTPSGDGKYFAFRVISFWYGAIDYYKDEIATDEKPLVSAMLCFLEINK